MLIDNGVGMNYEALVDMCMWGHEMRDDAGQNIGKHRKNKIAQILIKRVMCMRLG